MPAETECSARPATVSEQQAFRERGIDFEGPPSAVDHPRHYNAHPSGIECIDVVEHMSFNLGNVVKYVWRADEKGAPLQDLEKAQWYLQREISKRRAQAATPWVNAE